MPASAAAAAPSSTGWQAPASPSGRYCRWVRPARRLALLGALGLCRQPRVHRSERDGRATKATEYRGLPRRRARLARGLRAFEVLSAAHGAPWWHWPAEYRDREPEALERVRARAADELGAIQERAVRLCVQWQRLRELCARARRVPVRRSAVLRRAGLGGDVGAPRAVSARCGGPAARRGRRAAGLFFRVGQLWGNPLYDWGAGARDGFEFWRARVRVSCSASICCASIIFARWPRTGRCRPARPMRAAALAPHARTGAVAGAAAGLADLPLVAEDLGVITPDVEALRGAFDLPGMRVLQFGFDGDPTIRICRTCTDATAWSTPARTTTTRRVGWFASLRCRDAQPGGVLPARRCGSHARGADPRSLRLASRSWRSCRCRICCAWAPRRASIRPGPRTATGAGGCREHALDAELAQRYARLNRIYARA